jgi:hypothetical protein
MLCQAIAPVFTRSKANNSLERFAECSIRLVPNRLSEGAFDGVGKLLYADRSFPTSGND